MLGWYVFSKFQFIGFSVFIVGKSIMHRSIFKTFDSFLLSLFGLRYFQNSSILWIKTTCMSFSWIGASTFAFGLFISQPMHSSKSQCFTIYSHSRKDIGSRGKRVCLHLFSCGERYRFKKNNGFLMHRWLLPSNVVNRPLL